MQEAYPMHPHDVHQVRLELLRTDFGDHAQAHETCVLCLPFWSFNHLFDQLGRAGESHRLTDLGGKALK